MVCVDDVKLIDLPSFEDNRGTLVCAESIDSIPFDIKRIFYIFGLNKDAVRGKHANRFSSFVFVCVSGSCKIKIKDSDSKEMVVELNKPNMALFLPALLWKEMFDFSSDSILLVLSDKYYDSSEYIIDFDEYCFEMRGE